MVTTTTIQNCWHHMEILNNSQMLAHLLDIEQELLQKNEIIDLINNKYSGNSNANEDLESEDKDELLSLLSTHQDKTALEDTLHY
ncbi:hypothetical protein G9A89_016152 [Geosiphon pyriformis]|nr:hypothetical protein G9A89_016152 [Geosiphon pyriformis]